MRGCEVEAPAAILAVDARLIEQGCQEEHAVTNLPSGAGAVSQPAAAWRSPT